MIIAIKALDQWHPHIKTTYAYGKVAFAAMREKPTITPSIFSKPRQIHPIQLPPFGTR